MNGFIGGSYFGAFPRRRYFEGPSPLEHLPRLSAALGGPQIYIKRDDTLGPAGGGNKVRKLEFLVGAAIAEGADTLITSGSVQSNHCRLTAAVASREGLRCHLVLGERHPGAFEATAVGNNVLFGILGVDRVVVTESSQSDSLAEEEAEELRAQGRRPYVIPMGGSNVLGALGYVLCARELSQQSKAMGVQFTAVVAASGSGGTFTGLSAGFADEDAPRVIGVSVLHKASEHIQVISDLRRDCESRLAISTHALNEFHDEYIGPGYGIPTVEAYEAIELVARTEGILLDPIYTGKAMAGLIDLCRSGRFDPDDKVCFVHTGGSPALHAYPSRERWTVRAAQPVAAVVR